MLYSLLLISSVCVLIHISQTLKSFVVVAAFQINETYSFQLLI